MIKIILVGSKEESYVVTKELVSEFAFLYNSEIVLDIYKNLCADLKEEILKNDEKKIYLIEVLESNKNKRFNLIKFIRDNDFYNDIILLKDSSVLLDKSWANLYKIFSVIETNNKMKNILEKHLKIILDHFGEGKLFNFKNRDMDISIYFEKILYIYRDKEERKVMLVTDNNTYSINVSLKDIFHLLDERFKQVHRACVVNTKRIEKLDWSSSSIVLDNGYIINNMLSRHYKNISSD